MRLLLLVLLAAPLWATWSRVQQVQKTGGCAATDTCAVSVSAIGSGHVGVLSIVYWNASALTVSSITGGGTWSDCAACTQNRTTDNGGYGTLQSYILSTTGEATSVSVTLSGSASWFITEFREYAFTGEVSYDTGNKRLVEGAGEDPTNGPTLTLTGTNDLIVQVAGMNGTVTSVSAGWTDADFFTDDVGFADKINTNSGAAPTWDLTAAAGGALSGIAIKEEAAEGGSRKRVIVIQ